VRLLSTAGVRLACFAVALVVAFGAAYAVGNQVPDRAVAADGGHAQHGGTATTIDESQPHTHDTSPRPAATSADGYELRLDAGADAHTLTYHVVGPDGATVTRFADNHGALLHTVLVRPDLGEFQHVHPEIGADGTWTVTVPSGPWHLVFDLWPQGAATNVVLSTNADDEVPVASVALPAPDDTPTVAGLVVRRDGLTFTVTKPEGSPATGLGPYLGAPAHLILVRQGDLAYTHLHPAGTTMPGMPEMTTPAEAANVFTFTGTLPPGTYRAFLQFVHDGDLVTVAYTVTEDAVHE
jgi:hypothetical protein